MIPAYLHAARTVDLGDGWDQASTRSSFALTTCPAASTSVAWRRRSMSAPGSWYLRGRGLWSLRQVLQDSQFLVLTEPRCPAASQMGIG